MRFKLLAPHIIEDAMRPRGYIFEARTGYQPTPLMEGLDSEARAAVDYMKLKVWGRYPWPYGFYPPGYMGIRPLDNPPIPRPLDDNQPVYWYSGAPEYL